jgi:chromosome segregation ATPase
MESAFAKCEDNEKAIQKLIKQEKDTYEQRVDIMKSQQDVVEKDVDKTAAELKRLQKAFKDGEFNREEKKTLLDKLTADLNAKKKELANVEMAIKQRERSIERADRELRGLIKTWQDTTFKLSETEALRADTQQSQEETHLDFEIAKKDLQLEIHTLESEIYDQTEQREYLVKLNAELLKEVQDLRWYFKPQREKGEVESRIYGTREFDEIAKQASMRETEIENIKKEVSATNIEHEWKTKSMPELKKELDKTLQEMDPDMRGDILFELKDLTEAMKNQLFNQRRILAIVNILAKHEVYPGAIRELSVLTKMNDELHVMQRPEMLLKICHREFTREPDEKTFRRRLLEKLIEMRMKRTNRTYQQAEDFIFYGEERAMDDIADELEEIGEDVVDELPEEDE